MSLEGAVVFLMAGVIAIATGLASLLPAKWNPWEEGNGLGWSLLIGGIIIVVFSLIQINMGR